jgi:uncharacterized protein YyaL (SSP411 family)
MVYAGDARGGNDETLRAAQRRFLPNKVLAGVGSGDEAPALLKDLLTGKEAAGGEPTLYVCEGFTCQEPAVGGEQMVAKLNALTRRAAAP